MDEMAAGAGPAASVCTWQDEAMRAAMVALVAEMHAE